MPLKVLNLLRLNPLYKNILFVHTIFTSNFAYKLFVTMYFQLEQGIANKKSTKMR